MNIKDILRAKHKKGKLQIGLELLQRLSNDYEIINPISIQISELERTEKEYSTGSILREENNVHKNKIGMFFLNQVDDLPEDISILRNKVRTILIDYSAVTDSLDLILFIANEHLKLRLNQISNILSQRQESDDFETVVDNKDSWADISNRASQDIQTILSSLSFQDLKSNWQLDFLHFIEKNPKKYLARPNSWTIGEGVSDFYPDINKISSNDRNFIIKGTLFNWLENYLVNDFKKAYEILLAIRDQHGTGNAQFYEYLAMTYIHKEGFDKFVKQYTVQNSSQELKRLLFYLERINDKVKPTITKVTSLKYIFSSIQISINKVYQNIVHDYIIEGTSKGRSKKREIIKRSIDLALQVYQGCKFSTNDKTEISKHLLEYLVELEGAGKFPWIEIKQDKLIDSTVYNAVEKRHEIHAIVDDEKLINDRIYNELSMKAIEIQRSRPLDAKIKNRFYLACMLGHFNYKDDRYKELIWKVNNGSEIKREVYDLEVNMKDSTAKYNLSNFLDDMGVSGFKIDEETLKNTIAFPLLADFALDKMSFVLPLISKEIYGGVGGVNNLGIQGAYDSGDTRRRVERDSLTIIITWTTFTLILFVCLSLYIRFLFNVKIILSLILLSLFLTVFLSRKAKE